jgi:hypothetical protein
LFLLTLRRCWIGASGSREEVKLVEEDSELFDVGGVWVPGGGDPPFEAGGMEFSIEDVG